MPGSVLRASGGFKPLQFLRDSAFVPCNVFQKGERKAQNRSWASSGFVIAVSEASGDDLAQQIQDAIEFLRTHKEEVVRLRRFEGVDRVELDFGINRKSVFLQVTYLPSELVRLAGALGVGIEISIYGEDELKDSSNGQPNNSADVDTSRRF